MLFLNAGSRLSTTISSLVNSVQIRTAVIYHLPKPTEVKRVRKQGYKTRVKTKIGRQYIMTRILRGDKSVSQ